MNTNLLSNKELNDYTVQDSFDFFSLWLVLSPHRLNTLTDGTVITPTIS